MRNNVSGTFAAIGQGAPLATDLISDINISLAGPFVGTVQIERRFAGDVNWYPIARDATGAVSSFSAPTSISLKETEGDVSYRLNCTAFSSGSIAWRISQ